MSNLVNIRSPVRPVTHCFLLLLLVFARRSLPKNLPRIHVFVSFSLVFLSIPNSMVTVTNGAQNGVLIQRYIFPLLLPSLLIDGGLIAVWFSLFSRYILWEMIKQMSVCAPVRRTR